MTTATKCIQKIVPIMMAVRMMWIMNRSVRDAHYIDDDDSGAFEMALDGQCTRFAQYSRDNYFYTGPKLLHPIPRWI